MIAILRGLCGFRVVELRVATRILGVLASLFVTVSVASAQIRSGAGTVSLAATLPSSLTVTATPAVVNFALAPSGVSTGAPAVSITTRWSLATIASTLSLYAYFTAPTAALSDAHGDNIPAANVSGSVDGGGYAAFTGSSPFAGSSSITIFSQLVLGFNIPQQRTDTLNLRITTTGLALPAGSYSGLLVIQAQSI